MESVQEQMEGIFAQNFHCMLRLWPDPGSNQKLLLKQLISVGTVEQNEGKKSDFTGKDYNPPSMPVP